METPCLHVAHVNVCIHPLQRWFVGPSCRCLFVWDRSHSPAVFVSLQEGRGTRSVCKVNGATVKAKTLKAIGEQRTPVNRSSAPFEYNTSPHCCAPCLLRTSLPGSYLVDLNGQGAALALQDAASQLVRSSLFALLHAAPLLQPQPRHSHASTHAAPARPHSHPSAPPPPPPLTTPLFPLQRSSSMSGRGRRPTPSTSARCWRRLPQRSGRCLRCRLPPTRRRRRSCRRCWTKSTPPGCASWREVEAVAEAR